MSDRELDAIRQKRLRELRRHLERKTETEIKEEKAESPREILNSYFIDRAWEVFDAANVQYPEAAKYVENILVKLIREEKIKAQISGEELYGLFLRLGFRVRLQTRITVLEHGKVKSLEDKIKEETSQ
jgi:DNA-binding TFAR19-related protein (PDSD5 family)